MFGTMKGVTKITVFLIVLFCYVYPISSQNLGIPLPTLQHLGQGRKSVGLDHVNNDVSSHPTTGASTRGIGSLKSVNNPSADKTVQRLIKSPLLLNAIQEETKAGNAVKIDRVITAHKQVVSGQLIHLSLKVVETHCPLGSRNVDSCHTDTSEDPYLCEMAVWERPWLNSTKIVHEKSRCTEVEHESSFKNWLRAADDNTRYDDDSGFIEYASGSFPGTVDEKQVALEAFGYVDRGSQSGFKGQMTRNRISSIKYNPITNVTKIKVKIEYSFTKCIKLENLKVDTRVCPTDVHRNSYVCSVTVVSDPKYTTSYKVLPDDDDHIDCDEKSGVEELLIVPVKAPCNGCPQTKSVNDPKILELAEFAVMEYDRTGDDEELHKMTKLIKAHSQMESPVKYFLTLELGETDCQKSLSAFNMNRSFCNLEPLEEREICDMIVVDQPWQKTRELVQAKCSDKSNYFNRNKDELIVPVLLGSSRSRLPSQPLSDQSQHTLSDNIQQSVDLVLEYLNNIEHSVENHRDDDDDGVLVLQKVHKSETKAIPNGEEHHIVIEVGETVCNRSQRNVNCPLKHGEENEICEARVLQPSRRITFINCDDLDDYMKKEVIPYENLHQPFFASIPSAVPSTRSSSKTTLNFENDATANEIANFIVTQYNLQNDDDELYKLGRIISFSRQGSRNVKYQVELELLETECKKYQPISDVSKCSSEPGEESEFCQAEVTVSGDTSKQVTKLYCDDKEDFFTKKRTQLDPRPSLQQGEWKNEDTTMDKIKAMGELVANEYDLRSDEDQLYVLHRVVEAQTQNQGLKYYIHVELSETLCPKYKPRINKTRCKIDPQEELKICHAYVEDQPWRNGQQVIGLSCREKDDTSIEHHSVEVVYRNIHPSAHARPKFIKSVFKVIGSQESDESNEIFYYNGRTIQLRSQERDSDELFFNRPSLENASRDSTQIVHGTNIFLSREHDDHDRDSANDKDSRSHERLRFRLRRSLLEDDVGASVDDSSMLGNAKVMALNHGVVDLASRALFLLDTSTQEKKVRRLEEVLQATRKPQGKDWQWMLMLKVSQTFCSPKDILNLDKIKINCKPNPVAEKYLCILKVAQTPLDSLAIRKSKCYPESI